MSRSARTSTSEDVGADGGKYKLNEVVICDYRDMLYTAKITNKRPSRKGNGIDYRVHYMNWSSKHDEWLDGDARIKPNDAEWQKVQKEMEAEVKKKQAAEQAAAAARKRKARASIDGKAGGTPTSTPGGGKTGGAVGANSTGPRRIRNSAGKFARATDVDAVLDSPANGGGKSTAAAVANTASASASAAKSGPAAPLGSASMSWAAGKAGSFSRKRATLFIPGDLRERLVDDWNFICNEEMLVALPRDPSISSILREFRSDAANRGISDKLALEATKGLGALFCASVGESLLYRFERNQYCSILQSHEPNDLCDVYGAEHLLRLLVKFPEKLRKTSTGSDGEARDVLRVAAQIVGFLEDNAERFFVAAYENATPAYLRDFHNF